jgi:nucleotide-binding universal stress UspA family protein
MNRSIVCGVDGTEASRRAARVAGEFARDLHRRLVLVYVAHDPRTFPYGDPRLRELRHRRTVATVRPMLERTAAVVPDVVAETRVMFGDPVDALIAAGAEEDAELMVVGSRGRGPVASALLGSVSARLAAVAPCPVVVVPSPDAPTALTRADGNGRKVEEARIVGRFSTGIEDLPDAPAKRRQGRFSIGSEHPVLTRSELHVGRFSDGIARRQDTPAARRVGSFADGHDRARA